MKKWQKLSILAQKDLLVCLIIVLLTFILVIVLRYFMLTFNLLLWIPYLFFWISSGLYLNRRRKSIFRKVGLIMQLLDIPLSELRMVLKVGRYDMMEWNDRKTIITLSKLYKTLEYMEDQYFLAFHERFDEEKAIKKLAEKQFATNNTSVASD